MCDRVCPPAAVATCLTWPNVTSSWVNFSAAFVGVGLFWWNFLRIQYQQSTRRNQEDAADRINKVISDVSRVESLLRKLSPLVESIRKDVTPQQAIEISGVVSQANSAIRTAQSDLTDED